MSALRSLLRTCPRLAMLLLALALVTKLAVPAGYMLAVEHGRLAVVVCPDAMPAKPMHGAGHHGKSDKHAKPELPCAFASLAAPVTGPVDPVVLLLALASVALLALLRPAPVRVLAPVRWRPPLRAPPLAVPTC